MSQRTQCTHTYTQRETLSLSLSLSLTHSLAYTLTLSLSLTHSHSLSRTHACTHIHTVHMSAGSTAVHSQLLLECASERARDEESGKVGAGERGELGVGCHAALHRRPHPVCWSVACEEIGSVGFGKRTFMDTRDRPTLRSWSRQEIRQKVTHENNLIPKGLTYDIKNLNTQLRDI